MLYRLSLYVLLSIACALTYTNKHKRMNPATATDSASNWQRSISSNLEPDSHGFSLAVNLPKRLPNVCERIRAEILAQQKDLDAQKLTSSQILLSDCYPTEQSLSTKTYALNFSFHGRIPSYSDALIHDILQRVTLLGEI